MLVLDGLIKRFGAFTAVDNISLNVKSGEVLGFLGPNGAGKSTTMKMAAGFLTPDEGSATICGFDVVSQALEAKSHLGYLPEGAPAYGEMTPLGMLKFVASVRGLSGAKAKGAIERAIEEADLSSVAHQSVETLSKGFKRRVGLAQAILHDPDVLILDEPTDGLDPNQKHHVRNLIRTMSAEKAIIISTHILEEVDAVCSRSVIIDHGRIVADGTARELKQRALTHNCVVFRVAGEHADKAKKAIAALDCVSRVEQLSKAKAGTKLRAYPANSKSIAGEVAASLKAKRVPLIELSVEEGRLEEVFRDITEGEGAHA
ncbi:MAG: ABC transporter ATP-binding protein [Hyphomicrobiales bacterium]